MLIPLPKGPMFGPLVDTVFEIIEDLAIGVLFVLTVSVICYTLAMLGLV